MQRDLPGPIGQRVRSKFWVGWCGLETRSAHLYKLYEICVGKGRLRFPLNP